MVGTITKVRKQTLGLFQTIEVMPAVSLARTEIVLVVNAADDQPRNQGLCRGQPSMKLSLLLFAVGLLMVLLQTTFLHFFSRGS